LALSGPASVVDLALLTLAFTALLAAWTTEVVPSTAITSAASASVIAKRFFILPSLI